MPCDPGLAAEVNRLTQRVDCFYSWATQLQREIRELQEKRGPSPVRSEDEERLLLRRVGALKP
jgi:hypothetical protein